MHSTLEQILFTLPITLILSDVSGQNSRVTPIGVVILICFMHSFTAFTKTQKGNWTTNKNITAQ